MMDLCHISAQTSVKVSLMAGRKLSRSFWDTASKVMISSDQGFLDGKEKIKSQFLGYFLNGND